jgi:hypothetical protein
MAYFQTKNSNLGKFWKVFQWIDLVQFVANYIYFTTIWYILWSFGIFLVFLVHFSRFSILHQEKSGNPGHTDILFLKYLREMTGFFAFQQQLKTFIVT